MVSFHSESLDRLFEAILTLEDKEQCYAFFEDLCTIKELQDLSQRMDVAYLLDKGMNYADLKGSQRKHRHHQPCEQVPCLRKRRLQARP